MREDADEQAPFATHKVLRRDAAGFDLPRGNPGGRQCLQSVFAKGDRIAALSDAFHLAALAFAELHPLGHHWHRTPNTFKSRLGGLRPTRFTVLLIVVRAGDRRRDALLSPELLHRTSRER